MSYRVLRESGYKLTISAAVNDWAVNDWAVYDWAPPMAQVSQIQSAPGRIHCLSSLTYLSFYSINDMLQFNDYA